MYEKFLSEKVQTIRPSGIRKFFDLASQMEGVISLGVGEPDFDTPWHIREAAIYSIEEGRTHYTANQGLLELREEIVSYAKRRFNLDYDPNDNVIVTVGGSEAIDIAMRALVNPGDEVILMEPCYVAYTPSVELCGAKPVHIKLEHKDEFKLTPEKLEAAITPKSKVMLLNYPSNPTGGVMTKEDYEKLVPIIKKHELIVISDEIYAELTYDGEFCSLANFEEIKDQVIVINGFSKAFAMTGWRLGYTLANKEFTAAMNKIHQYIIMSAPTAAQYGAIEALHNGDIHVAEMKEAYESRRNFITKGFNRIGLPTHLPHGAFYIFPDIRSTGLTSDEFCEKLLAEEKVACVPGTAFGDAGEGFVRVSYAYSIEHIKEAIERIDHFMRNYR
ncbi:MULTISPECIES: aminotransferase class I/II-fold pyridoxal phosphate-dependent enzyme [Erysipelotrichaceae]|jgi:aminotransferase|uniref:Aminotransferase n=3 Tax=Bacillota TaxID=1239 RepID=A0A7G9GSZ7_9FIRM|nr:MULTISPECIES: aminotransferase class I/II-fold pyridoxal phosphate-dependent enzyme [Erysipelotrichaceae]QNM13929.1 aminotransferase class I/II-fold pyridoxal phosphate-dependent enzyme [[Eubacterium] hominis]MCH4283962.1 aminotransferase class I/II-fold pyridoxal phosphate-dependent enzyme [Amedibacillus hominis]RGB56841.1 aminotransferase class I/II-fold pyridoxal phosphate-dependent enzyme [Absiella sp. AM22-9]RGB60719.1 aminotransferase class I/II-fold pyridoxal phosphate-dependent enzym